MLDRGEKVVVNLDSGTTTGAVDVDETVKAETAITDGEEETVSVEAVSAGSATEGEAVEFLVALTGSVQSDVEVSYRTSDGSAGASDYTGVSATTLTFTGGETEKTVTVATTEDDLNEAAETFTVELTEVSFPAGVSLGTSSALGTIEDDDPVIAVVSADEASVDEGDDAVFTVTLSGGTRAADVVVDYTVSGAGGATAGDDYTAPSPTKLTIGTGATTGKITVETHTDTVLDRGEKVVVNLDSGTTTGAVDVDETVKAETAITDGEEETVSVEAVSAGSATEGEAVEFLVALTGSVQSDVEVSYRTSDGSAGASDYTGVSATTLTFTGGETSKTVTVATTEDDLNEAAETFTVELTEVSFPAGVSLGTSSALGTIEDDDPVIAVVSADEASVDEGDDAVFTVTLSGGTRAADVVVDYTVSGAGGATAGDDYTAPSPTKLTIGTGATTGKITVETHTDTVLDRGEKVVVNLDSGTTTGAVDVDETVKAETAITDGEEETVSVEAVSAGSATEGEAVEFLVALTGSVQSDVEVSYRTSDGSAGASDYTGVSATALTFTGGQTEKTVTVATTEDDLNEAAETFTVELTEVSFPAGVSLGTSSALGTIEDDDPVIAVVSADEASVDEGDDAVFTVTLSGGTRAADVVVDYTVSGAGGATAGDDYTAPSPTKLTIGTGATTGKITVETHTDTVLDRGEKVVVNLDSGTTTGAVDVDETVKAETAITDGEEETVSVEAVSAGSATEGEAVEFLVALTGSVQSDVEVSYRTSDGSAGATDYTGVSATALTFTGGETSKTVTVATTEDDLNEAAETFTVELTEVSFPAGVSLGTSSALGTIEDDDPVIAVVSADEASVDEGDDAVFTVTLSGGTRAADVVVDYTVSGAGGATAGDDYTAPSPTKLTIGTGATTGKITVETHTDTVLDRGEKVVVNLDSGTTTGAVDVDETVKAETAITDGEEETVSVEAVSAGSATEGEAVEFLVALTGSVQSDVEVSYRTSDGSAGANDYTGVSATALTFTGGETEKTVTVATTEDDLNEAAETFTVELTEVSFPAGVSLGTSSALGTIVDDDPVIAVVSADEASVDEGDDAVFTVTLSGGTRAADVVVDYTVSGAGGATAGDDYTAPSPTKLTIGTGATTGKITVETHTDTVLDRGEKVVVNLDSGTTTGAVDVDETVKAETAITDGEEETVSVEAVSAGSATEGEAVEFLVALTGSVQSDVEVSYRTSDGSAGANDYTGVSATALTFTGGETSKTVTVATTEDDLNEAAETFTVELTEVSFPAGVSLGTSSALGTIVDDDPVIAVVSADEASVDEGDDAVFTVTLSGGTRAADVVVDYTVSGAGGATAGDDYTAPSPTKLTIGTGATTGKITVETHTDTVLDRGEKVVVNLDSGTTTGAVDVDETVKAETAITDGEEETVSVEAVSAGSATEGEAVEFLVALTGSVQSDVEVSYRTSDGSAGASDYTGVSATALTFTGGETSKTVTVATTEDDLNEAAETFTVELTEVSFPAGVSLGTSSALGTIVDDDPVIAVVSADEASVDEGDDAVFTVTLSGGTRAADVVVDYTVSGAGGATAGDDYTAPSPTKLTIGTGATTGKITVETHTDTVLDRGEKVVVNLDSGTTTGAVDVDETVKAETAITDGEEETVSVRRCQRDRRPRVRRWSSWWR